MLKGALPTVVSAGVCHRCAVSGVAVALGAGAGVVSHSVSVVWCSRGSGCILVSRGSVWVWLSGGVTSTARTVVCLCVSLAMWTHTSSLL